MTIVYCSLQYTEYIVVRVYSENQEFRMSIVCFDCVGEICFSKGIMILYIQCRHDFSIIDVGRDGINNKRKNLLSL